MITLITSLLVSFSNDELNRILQSDAIKNMAVTASMSQSQISIHRSVARGNGGATGKRGRRGRESDDDDDDDYDDEDDDEVQIDKSYDDRRRRQRRTS